MICSFNSFILIIKFLANIFVYIGVNFFFAKDDFDKYYFELCREKDVLNCMQPVSKRSFNKFIKLLNNIF